jgi:hypothetical protein
LPAIWGFLKIGFSKKQRICAAFFWQKQGLIKEIALSAIFCSCRDPFLCYIAVCDECLK